MRAILRPVSHRDCTALELGHSCSHLAQFSLVLPPLFVCSPFCLVCFPFCLVCFPLRFLSLPPLFINLWLTLSPSFHPQPVHLLLLCPPFLLRRILKTRPLGSVQLTHRLNTLCLPNLLPAKARTPLTQRYLPVPRKNPLERLTDSVGIPIALVLPQVISWRMLAEYA